MTQISDFAFTKLHPGQTISLGGGSNVADLNKKIAEEKLPLTLFSPSPATRELGNSLGLVIAPIEAAEKIDLAFDGADSVDYDLRTLKSKGGIHLFEKVAANLADQYILLLPFERIQAELNPEIQLCLEVATPALKPMLELASNLGLKASVRSELSILGNSLVDLWNQDWSDIAAINQKLLTQNGVLASSLFETEVTSVITVKNGQAAELTKGDF